MAKTTKTDANWTTIDIGADLADVHVARYNAYKAAYAAMKAARLEFENGMSETIAPPAGKRVIFGYNFGKLSIAIVDDDRKAVTAKPAASLADWISAQRDANRSC